MDSYGDDGRAAIVPFAVAPFMNCDSDWCQSPTAENNSCAAPNGAATALNAMASS